MTTYYLIFTGKRFQTCHLWSGVWRAQTLGTKLLQVGTAVHGCCEVTWKSFDWVSPGSTDWTQVFAFGCIWLISEAQLNLSIFWGEPEPKCHKVAAFPPGNGSETIFVVLGKPRTRFVWWSCREQQLAMTPVDGQRFWSSLMSDGSHGFVTWFLYPICYQKIKGCLYKAFLPWSYCWKEWDKHRIIYLTY